MEVLDAQRQIEEILTLKEQWHGDTIEVKTPALFSRLQKVTNSSVKTGRFEVKKCLMIHVKCWHIYPEELKDLLLEIEFPHEYPSETTCRLRALHASDLHLEYKSCTKTITNYVESMCGFECVESVMDWISENKDSCLIENENGNDSSLTGNDREGKVQCFILRYNHLLSGREHKKEKSMLDAAKKSKLQGGLLWGTPGVVIVVPPSTFEDANEYASDCRTIGKRPDGVEEVWLRLDCAEEAGLGGLAQQKRGGKLRELDTATLRIACDDENVLRMVLGVH